MVNPRRKAKNGFLLVACVFLGATNLFACAPLTMANPAASTTKTVTEMIVTGTTQENEVPLSIPTLTPSPTPEPGKLVVDVTQRENVINPLVFGSNAGPWQTITSADINSIKAAGFTILRYPGGNYVDENAPSRTDLDAFIEMCREVGAEPMVQVKLVNATAKSAAEMVTYANITQGYGIRYWSIGNEPSLYLQNRGIQVYDTELFNQQWREFAVAMKAVDPSILLLGPETHQYTGKSNEAILDLHSRDWMREFLIANGDLVDIVAFHRYPFGSFDPSKTALLRSSEEWDFILPNLKQLIIATTGREIPIAVTEVNSNWSNRSRGETTPDALVNAIWWADALGRMMKHDVSIVNQFALDGTGGWALFSAQEPRPSYYVYLLYRDFGSQLVASTSGIDLVSVIAALDDSGNLTLVIVNRNPKAVPIPMELRGFKAGGSDRWVLLDEEHMAEEIPGALFGNLSSLELPAHSAVFILLEPGG